MSRNSVSSTSLRSIFPDALDPALYVNVWTGPPKTETGLPENVYSLDSAGLTQLKDAKGDPLRVLLKERGVKVVIEKDAAWLKRAPQFVGEVPRIRLIGGDAGALAVALDGSPELAVHAGEVTRAGRLELLPFLREQSVSATAHRFGNPTPLLDGIL